jgi:hypothetical protein
MKPGKVVFLAALVGALVLALKLHIGGPAPAFPWRNAAPARQERFQIRVPDPGRNSAHDDLAPPRTPERRSATSRSKTNAVTVTHSPSQPKAGELVTVTARFSRAEPTGELQLQYQPVDPGKYIALKDGAFEKRWETLPMQRDGNGTFAAQLPASLQQHRRLVRYRIRSVGEGRIVAPEASDAQPNYAYFVYDGVPPWQGAVNPNARDEKARTPVTFPSEALQRVPVYHLISSKAAVEKATWSQEDDFGGNRNQYRFTGTLVYDGVVYDHVGFRARGGGWRHAMGKNMWKFNFLPGHRFEARDFYGNPYRAKWDKLNLGACIQQGDYGMRGEQGMFEALGFRLFNLAGMEASRTHWVHFRIIDEADESPRNQYSGDFWGLYLAVENVDEHFLKEHDLPPGNLYKMEFAAKTAFNGNPAVRDQSDVHDFMRRIMVRGQTGGASLADAIDLDRYYAYRGILECIHHYDIDSGKNYFYYLNPQSGRWVSIPWDIDLSWGDRMFGGGQEPFYRSGLLSKTPYKQQYQERLAEIRDLLFNPEEAGKLIDEHAAMIWSRDGRPSLVDADRAKWDYNPVMVSGRVFPEKAGQGLFYFGNPRNTFGDMVKYMKSWVAKRSSWIDHRLLADYRPPPAPAIEAPSRMNFQAPELELRLRAGSSGAPRQCQWRLAEITDPSSPGFQPAKPWKYEIEASWQGKTASSEGARIPTKLLQPQHTYRIRVRWQETGQPWSRWSAPVQFTVP